MRLSVAVLFVALLGCGSGGDGSDEAGALSEEHRTALRDSVIVFASDVVTLISEKKVDEFMAAHADDPDLTYAAAGRIYPSKDTIHGELRNYFASPAAEHVQFALGDNKVNIVDANTAMLTGIINSMNRDSLGNIRRGHQAWSVLLVRQDSTWKILQAHESYPRSNAASAEE